MSVPACIGLLSLGCWILALNQLWVHLGQWPQLGLVGAIVPGLFMWLGAGTAVMCLASTMAEMAEKVKTWGS